MSNDFLEKLRASIKQRCGCCGVQVTGFDGEYVRAGLCPTCRSSAQNSLGVSGADMLGRVHLAKSCPVNVRAREARR